MKDIVQRPLRTILAGLSVVLAVIALLITLGFRSTIDVTTARPDVVGDPWDVAVVPTNDADRDQLTTVLDDSPNVAGWFGESEGREIVDGDVVLARAVYGDPAAAAYLVREGRNMVTAGEGLAGYGLLERLGRSVGDTVTVEIEGVTIPVLIVGRYSEVEDSGDVLLFRSESLSDAFPDAVPGVYRVVATPGTTPAELAAELDATLGDVAEVQPLVIETDEFDAFGVAFWMVAGLVLLVALANLGATILLGVRERMRDLGVLRTIGFTPSQLVESTAIGTALLVSVSVAIGIPIGLLLNRMLLSTVGRAIGAGPELRAAPAAGAVVLFVGTVVVLSVAIGAATCVRASRRPVSELITYE